MKQSGYFYIFFLLTTLIFSFSACHPAVDEGSTETFSAQDTKEWLGPNYWSNPLQDWQLYNKSLQCLVSGPNRNVHILTKRLDSIPASLHMQVDFKFLYQDTSQTRNWAGFLVGARGEFNDYRDDAVFGKGLQVGITTKGRLFIDSLESELTVSPDVLLNMHKLKLDISENRAIRISVFHKEKEIAVHEVTWADDLWGDIALVAHYSHKKNHQDFNRASVVFDNWEIKGGKISQHIDHVYGPILFTQYTLSKDILKITAQLAPISNNGIEVLLQLQEGGRWETVSQSYIEQDSRTASFRIMNWSSEEDIPYRVSISGDYEGNGIQDYYWEGTIRKDPIDKDAIVIAGFTGNSDLGFPNNDITDQIAFHDPDLLFFSGDQIYESVGGYGAQRAPEGKAMLDYLRKWYLYGWAYRDLLKDRPSIAIPDDHDVYHGNIWGAGGRDIPDSLGQGAKAQDYGGYKMSPRWVNMVQRTQTSHLPDPYDPTPVEQGIEVYYTDMVYGGISFAIIEDRKWKSPPKEFLPEAKVWNGWSLNRDFDMKARSEAPGAEMLGDRQLNFLQAWAGDWSHQAKMKMLLSQTIFANVATLPEEAQTGAVIPTLRVMHKGDYAPNDRPVADMDSNGWPSTERDKAVKAIRKGFAFHLAGDQHLGSTIQYGVDDYNDSGYALCVPSISNYWPRRWYPQEKGGNRDPEMPRYTGEYEDGFGNKMTVHAVSNPLFTGKKPAKLYDRAAGYGIVRMNKDTRKITIECWPRQADPEQGDKVQYDGWPMTIDQMDNYGRQAKAYLPEIKVEGIINPVIEVRNEKTGELVYALRIKGTSYKPKIFNPNISYHVKVGDPDRDWWKEEKGVIPGTGQLLFSL